jgi:integrase
MNNLFYLCVKLLAMSSVKVVLRKKPNKAGLYPISVRITKDRKSSFLYTGQYINEKDWDSQNSLVKKSHPNSKRLNNLILKKLSEANERLLQDNTDKSDLSALKIKDTLIGKAKKDFFEIASIFLTNLKKNKKFNQYYNQDKRLSVFKAYLNRSTLNFADLDVTMLKNFETYLLFERKVTKRTAINYLMLIRTIYNFARKEYQIDDRNYPFGKGKIQIKFPETEKIGLNADEIKRLEEVQDISPAQLMAVRVWLLSFYFAGIRVGDVLKLKWTDFKDGRLYYRMGKNQKLLSLAIPRKAQDLLDTLKGDSNNSGLVFHFLEGTNLNDKKRVETRIKTITRNLNRRLSIVADKLQIDKKLSMHIARHSFGNISGDKIPIQMLQKLYRHSSITTTINYQQNFMHKETDEALDKVINF